MKIALVIANNIKQVILTPETDQEKKLLKVFDEKDEMTVQIHVGENAFITRREIANYNIATCRGGYLRPFEDENSVMITLTPKAEVK